MDDFQFNWQGQGPITPPTFVTPRQRAEEQQALQQKEARKAEIRKRLAEIDALLAKHGQYSVAAEAARIGDMSPYMQILSQQQNASATSRAATQGIENTLYQAEGLLGGLKSAASEDREQYLAKIKSLQNQARDRAKAAGMSDADFEKLPVNQRVKEAVDQYEGVTKAADETYLAFETDIKKKAQDKVLHDADLANLRAKADEYGNNSKDGRKLLDLIDKYENETVEARNKRTAGEAEALALVRSINNLETLDEQGKLFGSFTDRQKKLIKGFHPDVYKRFTEYR